MPKRGEKTSESTRAKQSAARTGWKPSQDTREKMSASAKKRHRATVYANRVCMTCGVTYTPTSNSQKYCSIHTARGGFEYLRELRSTVDTCQICGRNDRAVVVDHCADCRKIRGFLCTTCNTGIGALRHSRELLERACLYLDMTLNSDIGLHPHDRGTGNECDHRYDPVMVPRFTQSTTTEGK